MWMCSFSKKTEPCCWKNRWSSSLAIYRTVLAAGDPDPMLVMNGWFLIRRKKPRASE